MKQEKGKGRHTTALLTQHLRPEKALP